MTRTERLDIRNRRRWAVRVLRDMDHRIALGETGDLWRRAAVQRAPFPTIF